VPTDGVFQDAKGKPFTSTWWTKKAIGADIANEGGFKGQGTTAVVIDSGARTTHPQLRGAQALSAAREKGQSGRDANGHGTWCSACVGGSFATDRAHGAPVEGMAPETNLVSIQALGFVVGVGSSVDIIKAMEMSLGLGADVVSMSLGSNDAPPDTDNPEAIAIKKMVEADIIPVIAGGNSGPTPETIGSPGSVNEALTVGAHDPVTGELADFSSRGPTGGDGLIKPDVVAPGVMIDSALVGLLDTMVDPKARQFGAISGTSMATPHVAGLLANARQFYREKLDTVLTVDMVKDAMRLNAEANGIVKDSQMGWGAITWDILTKFADELKPRKRVVEVEEV
jgi:subtilisin family serine protease